MGSRLELHDVLCDILGSAHVYFQPPASVQMIYPAIVYSRKNIESNFADDSVYKQNHAYELTVIYEDPDSDIPVSISQLPLCRFDRHYTADNLNHDSFTLYY